MIACLVLTATTVHTIYLEVITFDSKPHYVIMTFIALASWKLEYA